MTRKLNWRPDLPDWRDHKYPDHAAMLAAVHLPVSVDLRPNCPPVVDQGQIGSCTGNSLAGALGYLEWAQVGAVAFQPFSRLFIYYNERLLEGDPDQDGGASLRDGIKTLHKQGACFEELWTYSQGLVFLKPLASAYEQALPHRISKYLSIRGTDIHHMKDCLAQGYPFVFGFTVYESFESPEVAKTGIMPMPKPTESVLGGHAILCVGYDDVRQVFIVRNSWGEGWGDKGYFYMPYAYITDPGLANSFWTVRK